jgi:hypothetical protein
MKYLALLFLLPSNLFAQSENGFRFGSITYSDLEMKIHAEDTTAAAVILNEFGETSISNNDPFNLVFDYHVKIKILKREGFDQANFEIPLRISGTDKEFITEVQASTFNLDHNSIKEAKLDPKNIFLENRNKYWDYKKFTLPDIRIGSIIDIHYVLESPFKFNWRSWEFQSDIPKINSEYWAHIPGNYVYNVTLRGAQALSKNESEVENQCYTIGGSTKADCALFKYAMKDIPAFKEEKFMTAKSNFLSCINYELLEFRRFDGIVTKYTDEWKDVNQKLQSDDQFGNQIKQARKIWSDNTELLTKPIDSPLAKAKITFDQIKNYYRWDEVYGHFTELGAKKAFQSKKGNVADINLSLAGALQSIGLQAEPALVSTRENGSPVMLHPVMSDFNYVIVRVTVGAEQFWLDATHPLHPFGFVPERCLNGKVRVIGANSDWVDIKSKNKDKKVIALVLTVKDDGKLSGSLKITHFGYDAFDQRKKYFSFSTSEEYWKDQARKWDNFEVISYASGAADSLDKPFEEKYELNFAETADANVLYFSPFIVEQWKNNPFRSAERNYPVDFGAPLEEITLLTLNYPTAYSVDDLPKSVAITLPQNGGRYLFNTSIVNDKIQMMSSLTLNKSVYTPTEYHALKELFSRVIQSQESQIVLKKK